MIRFDEKFIEGLLAKLNIVDVIGAYCQLTRKGGSYWACCPLPGHSERTPSFAVNEAGQFYKCFGCGRGGDAIKFIMEMENMEFRDAVIFLCEKAHVALPEDDGSAESERVTAKKQADKTRLYSLMRDAALFYVQNLQSQKAAAHNAYLKKRGLERAEVRAFGLGASTDYQSLVSHLLNKGYTKEEMLLSGACQKNREGSGCADAVATRLIFPIIDAMGRVIAFGGRKLEKTDFGKYKNTGESLLFSKRKALYNINNLKKLRSEQGKIDSVIIVEGYMDTIALHKAGFKNVVASMGTSLTVEQARLVKRYTDVALICYDGDSAGQNATVRGLEILAENGLEVRIVCLPDGLDPDELIAQRGKEAYQACLDQALPLIDFKLKMVSQAHDKSTLSGKRRYIEESLRIISECSNLSLQEELLKRLRDESGLTYDSLQRDLDRLKGDSSAKPTSVTAETVVNLGGTVTETAERFVLAAYVAGESYATELALPEVFMFTHPFRKELSEYICASIMLNKQTEPELLRDFAGEANLEELLKILSALEEVAESARERYFNDCAALLQKNKIKCMLAELKEQFDGEQDREKRQETAKKIQQLTLKLSRL